MGVHYTSQREKVHGGNESMKKNENKILIAIIVVLGVALIALGVYTYNQRTVQTQTLENQYNMAFYEVVDYVQNVETYLAKSLISTTPEHGAETLTQVWRQANLASAYLTQLPVSTEEMSKTVKFLNQVSDYSYSLSRKNIYNEPLNDEDLKNLKELHDYSLELKDTLNQLSLDMQDGRVSWKELTQNNNMAFTQQVSNISKDSFSNLGESFQKYEGLIYDGAYSEHITTKEKLGLTGDDIDEETAKQKASDFFGREKIEEINSIGYIENGEIPVYEFSIKIKGTENFANIAISKKGGHIVLMNYNRDVASESISQEEADEYGKKFLDDRGFKNMKETYYLKEDGIVTVNYAYQQDDVVIYPDLIKLKIALDNGEILGIETTGYLNSHHERQLEKPKITQEQAKQTINKDLEILSEGLAIIPTEWETEILCYEFKGKVDGLEFLVYINAENGREENILVIINTPNGTLTM